MARQQCAIVQPSPEVLSKLSMYRVDVQLGKIFNWDKEVGNPGGDGYYRITIYPKGQKRVTLRRAHIVFWAHHGRWPTKELDHEDRDRHNDSIGNLKEVSGSVQQANTANSLGRTLPVGVQPSRMQDRPYATVYKMKWVSYHTTPEAAHEAYLELQRKDT